MSATVTIQQKESMSWFLHIIMTVCMVVIVPLMAWMLSETVQQGRKLAELQVEMKSVVKSIDTNTESIQAAVSQVNGHSSDGHPARVLEQVYDNERRIERLEDK